MIETDEQRKTKRRLYMRGLRRRKKLRRDGVLGVTIRTAGRPKKLFSTVEALALGGPERRKTLRKLYWRRRREAQKSKSQCELSQVNPIQNPPLVGFYGDR